MRKGSIEYYEIIDNFERYITGKHFPHYLPLNLTKAPYESKETYENGTIQMAFNLYQAGYALGRIVYMDPSSPNNPAIQGVNKTV